MYQPYLIYTLSKKVSSWVLLIIQIKFGLSTASPHVHSTRRLEAKAAAYGELIATPHSNRSSNALQH
jgi:hypothetical protein